MIVVHVPWRRPCSLELAWRPEQIDYMKRVLSTHSHSCIPWRAVASNLGKSVHQVIEKAQALLAEERERRDSQRRGGGGGGGGSHLSLDLGVAKEASPSVSGPDFGAPSPVSVDTDSVSLGSAALQAPSPMSAEKIIDVAQRVGWDWRAVGNELSCDPGHARSVYLEHVQRQVQDQQGGSGDRTPTPHTSWTAAVGVSSGGGDSSDSIFVPTDSLEDALLQELSFEEDE